MKNNVKISCFFVLTPILSLTIQAEEAASGPVKIMESYVQDHGERRVFIERMEPMKLEEHKVKAVDGVPNLGSSGLNKGSRSLQRGHELVHESYAISVDSFSDGPSLVKWWSLGDGESGAMECWSNIDWSHLTSVHTHKNKRFSYTFMLFTTSAVDAGSTKTEEVPTLPAMETHGPKFQLIGKREDYSRAGLRFMKTMHRLYGRKKDSLERTSRLKEKERVREAEELRLNPPAPKDVRIRFWKNPTRLKNSNNK